MTCCRLYNSRNPWITVTDRANPTFLTRNLTLLSSKVNSHGWKTFCFVRFCGLPFQLCQESLLELGLSNIPKDLSWAGSTLIYYGITTLPLTCNKDLWDTQWKWNMRQSWQSLWLWLWNWKIACLDPRSLTLRAKINVRKLSEK